MINLSLKFFYLFNILYILLFVCYLVMDIIVSTYNLVATRNWRKINYYACHTSSLNIISYLTLGMFGIYLSVFNNLGGFLHNLIKSLIVKNYTKTENNLVLNIKEDFVDIYTYIKESINNYLAQIQNNIKQIKTKIVG